MSSDARLSSTDKSVGAERSAGSAAVPVRRPSDEPVFQLQSRLGNRTMAAALSGNAASVAQSGTRGQSTALPHLAQIQRAFGPAIDLSMVRAHVGSRAAEAAHTLGAHAYTIGRDVAFSDSPSLHTAAHEAAHVVQQQSAPSSAASRLSSKRDPAEGQAELIADAVERGDPAEHMLSSPLSATSGVIQREVENSDGPPDSGAGPAAPSSLPLLEESIADQYPSLIAPLSVADLTGLEAASKLRYAALRDARAAHSSVQSEADAALSKAARPAVEVRLETLLAPDARFVDADVWAELYYLIRMGATAGDVLGADPYTLQKAELVRNEIVRRYFRRIGLLLADPVRIELLDPAGTVQTASRLQFSVGGRVLYESRGLVSPAELLASFGPIAPDIAEVTHDAETVALGALLMVELEDVEPTVYEVMTGVQLKPADYAVRAVERLSGRVAYDRRAAQDFAARSGPKPPQTGGVQARLEALGAIVLMTLRTMRTWHDENSLGKSIGMRNEDAAEALGGWAQRQVDKGGIHKAAVVPAFIAFLGVAVSDATEELLSFDYHNVATQVVQAYDAGDISWNDSQQLLKHAFRRALLEAAITRYMGLGASRLGAGASLAERVGLAQGTKAFGAVSGLTSGALTSSGSLLAQTALTKAGAGQFTNPASQAIWDRGIPTVKDFGIAAVVSAGFEGLFGVFASPPAAPTSTPFVESPGGLDYGDVGPATADSVTAAASTDEVSTVLAEPASTLGEPGALETPIDASVSAPATRLPDEFFDDALDRLNASDNPFELNVSQKMDDALRSGEKNIAPQAVGFDVDEPLPVGDPNIKRQRQVDRALDPQNRQLLDPATNRRTKGLRVSADDILRGRASLAPISVSVDPNAVLTRRFGEVVELRQVFDEAVARVDDMGRFRPTELKARINANIRDIIQNGRTPAGVLVRDTLTSLGFEFVPNRGLVAVRVGGPITHVPTGLAGPPVAEALPDVGGAAFDQPALPDQTTQGPTSGGGPGPEVNARSWDDEWSWTEGDEPQSSPAPAADEEQSVLGPDAAGPTTDEQIEESVRSWAADEEDEAEPIFQKQFVLRQ